MTRLRLARRLAMAAISLCAASLSFAQAPSRQACVGVAGLNSNQLLCGVDSNTPTTLAGTQIGAAGVPINSGSGAALAQFSTLKASTSATNILHGSGAGASAISLVRDSLAISSPGREGQQGYVDFRIDYSWRFSNVPFGSDDQSNTADVTLEFGAGAAYARQYQMGAVSTQVPIGVIGDNVTALSALLNNSFTVRMPFVFGVEYNLRQALAISSQAQNGNTAWINAFNSAYWGGMVVRDESLNLVSFSAESGSGTDYTRSYAPVPEPGTWLLAVTGILALGTLRRVRQGRTSAA